MASADQEVELIKETSGLSTTDHCDTISNDVNRQKFQRHNFIVILLQNVQGFIFSSKYLNEKKLYFCF